MRSTAKAACRRRSSSAGPEENEDLGGGVERERLEARGALTKLGDGGRAPSGEGGERVGGGLVHGGALPHAGRACDLG